MLTFCNPHFQGQPHAERTVCMPPFFNLKKQSGLGLAANIWFPILDAAGCEPGMLLPHLGVLPITIFLNYCHNKRERNTAHI